MKSVLSVLLVLGSLIGTGSSAWGTEVAFKLEWQRSSSPRRFIFPTTNGTVVEASKHLLKIIDPLTGSIEKEVTGSFGSQNYFRSNRLKLHSPLPNHLPLLLREVGGSLNVIDAQKGELLFTKKRGVNVDDFVVSPLGRVITQGDPIVIDPKLPPPSDDAIVAFDFSGNKVWGIPRSQFGDFIGSAFDLNPQGDVLFTVDNHDGRALFIDVASGRLLKTLFLPVAPDTQLDQLAYTNDGKKAVAIDVSGDIRNLFMIDIASDKVDVLRFRGRGYKGIKLTGPWVTDIAQEATSAFSLVDTRTSEIFHFPEDKKQIDPHTVQFSENYGLIYEPSLDLLIRIYSVVTRTFIPSEDPEGYGETKESRRYEYAVFSAGQWSGGKLLPLPISCAPTSDGSEYGAIVGQTDKSFILGCPQYTGPAEFSGVSFEVL